MTNLISLGRLMLFPATAVLAAFAGCSLIGPSPLPTEGIVATAAGGEDWLGGNDRLTGKLSLERGCVVVSARDGREVVPVFRAGAAEADGLNKLTWKGRTYREGSKISVDGDAVGPVSALPNWTNYYFPGGCLRFKQAILVNQFPESH